MIEALFFIIIALSDQKGRTKSLRELQVVKDTISWPAETPTLSHGTSGPVSLSCIRQGLTALAEMFRQEHMLYAYLLMSSFGHRSRLSQWMVRPCAAAPKSQSFSHHARFTRLLASVASHLCLFMSPQVLLGRKYSTSRAYKKGWIAQWNVAALGQSVVVGVGANVGPKGYELRCTGEVVPMNAMFFVRRYTRILHLG